MNIRDIQRVHFIGIGGINMSAVAKILLAHGVRVSGSDVKENEQTTLLRKKGARILIGEKAEHIEEGTDLVIYTSAAPITNVERQEASRRAISQCTNFQFLGEWFAEQKIVLVTGTHGKSTTTAMLGNMLVQAGMDPTVIVGSKVPGLSDGNLRLGNSDIVVIEGDEYARHFLEFKPYAVIINNIELDHTDVFSSLEDMTQCFEELLDRVQVGGLIVANAGDDTVDALLVKKIEQLSEKNIRVMYFNVDGSWKVTNEWRDGVNQVRIEHPGDTMTLELRVPGIFNAINAAGAALMARELGAEYQAIASSLLEFSGIWRRFEKLGEHNGSIWYSDYGHHPTAVAATIRAIKEAYPQRRLILCFQPHHRNRTKHLFFEFVTCFEKADAVVLCEIYDVAGRDAGSDADISSHDLYEAAIRHDREHGGNQHMEYAESPMKAIEQTAKLALPGDIVVIMGAGDIDDAVRRFISRV